MSPDDGDLDDLISEVRANLIGDSEGFLSVPTEALLDFLEERVGVQLGTVAKAAYHETWGGSPRHDSVNEYFQSGWDAALAFVSGRAL